jgi:PAS domain S-box-containing protein
VNIDGRPHAVTVSLDVTEYLRDQSQLREHVRLARDRLQAMLQALPDLLFEFDEDGVVHDFFSSQHELLTQPPERFLGKRLTETTSPEIAATIMGAIREAVANGIAVGAQYRVPESSGGRWFEMSVARRSEQAADGKARVIAIARDITQRKRHEQELEVKNDELMRFTYTVSHDLKSPLVTIESFLGFLVDDLACDDRARVQHDIERIRSATERMDVLLADLLRLSRVGHQLHPTSHVSLRQLIAEACELSAARLRTSQAQLTGPDLDLQLWGDPLRLRELLQNLLDNALKFTRPGVQPEVRIAFQARALEWIVSIEDNGIGIDPRHQHKLFGLFEKLRPDSDGSGIGLALVRRIVDGHGGRIWIESKGEGQGTCVRFTLPGTKQEPAA